MPNASLQAHIKLNNSHFCIHCRLAHFLRPLLHTIEINFPNDKLSQKMLTSVLIFIFKLYALALSILFYVFRICFYRFLNYEYKDKI